MAIGGSTTPSFEARLRDDKLILNRQALRLSVIEDASAAARVLLEGDGCYVAAHHPVIEKLSQLVELAVGKYRLEPGEPRNIQVNVAGNWYWYCRRDTDKEAKETLSRLRVGVL